MLMTICPFVSLLLWGAGELPLDVTNLRILPGMGKIEFTAGSPGWGTRGERCPHHDATLKRVA